MCTCLKSVIFFTNKVNTIKDNNYYVCDDVWIGLNFVRKIIFKKFEEFTFTFLLYSNKSLNIKLYLKKMIEAVKLGYNDLC